MLPGAGTTGYPLLNDWVTRGAARSKVGPDETSPFRPASKRRGIVGPLGPNEAIFFNLEFDDSAEARF